MRISQAHDRWPEAHLRERRWALADEARTLVHQADQLRLLDVACRRIAALDPE
jgi:hypothetical protein